MQVRSFTEFQMPRTRRRRQRGRERTDDLFLRPSLRPTSPYIPTPLAPAPVAPPARAVSTSAPPPAEAPAPRLTQEASRAESEGNLEQSLELLTEGLRRAPDAVELLVLRGAILARQGRYAEAEA